MFFIRESAADSLLAAAGEPDVANASAPPRWTAEGDTARSQLASCH